MVPEPEPEPVVVLLDVRLAEAVTLGLTVRRPVNVVVRLGLFVLVAVQLLVPVDVEV